MYDEEFLDRVSKQLSEFSDFKMIGQQDNTVTFNFNFDFGNGEKEPVEMTFIRDDIYNLSEPKEDIGAIISFISGPSHAPAFYQKNLQKKLVNGGITFDTDDSPLYSLAIDKYGDKIFGDNNDEDSYVSYQRKVKKIYEKEKELAQEYGFKICELGGTRYRLFTKVEENEKWLDLLDDVATA